MTYVCTKCDWQGDGIYKRPVYGLISGITCPVCDSPVIDLDVAERSAIRQDGGQSKEEADREAIRELEEWRKDLA